MEDRAVNNHSGTWADGGSLMFSFSVKILEHSELLCMGSSKTTVLFPPICPNILWFFCLFVLEIVHANFIHSPLVTEHLPIIGNIIIYTQKAVCKLSGGSLIITSKILLILRTVGFILYFCSEHQV